MELELGSITILAPVSTILRVCEAGTCTVPLSAGISIGLRYCVWVTVYVFRVVNKYLATVALRSSIMFGKYTKSPPNWAGMYLP